jgi:hypothetical protein
MTATADLGLARVSGVRGRLGAGPLGRPAIVGITFQLTDWLNRGRTLNTDAVRLNANMVQFVPPTNPLLTGWTAWYAAWQPYYAKYIGPDAGALAQSNVSVNYDSFNADLKQRQSQFNSLLAQYNAFAAAQDAKGGTIPQQTPTPVPLPDAPGTGDAPGLPWWFWTGFGVLAVGGGYLLYRSYQNAKAGGAYVAKHPEILAGL